MMTKQDKKIVLGGIAFMAYAGLALTGAVIDGRRFLQSDSTESISLPTPTYLNNTVYRATNEDIALIKTNYVLEN